MWIRRWSIALAGWGLVGLTLTPPARGGGFAIFEQGAGGMAFGGAFVAQSDPSSIFHNAAGIAFLRGKQLYGGLTGIRPSVDFTGDNPFPGASVTESGDAGVLLPLAVDYTQQVAERLVFGVGLHSPYGLRTRWKDRDTTFSGRFISKEAQVDSVSINPTVAYKLQDRLAVGAGLDVRLAKIFLEHNVGAINPFTQRVLDVATVELRSNWATGIGFNLGLLARPAEGLSIGVAYRHKVKVDFRGDATFTLIPSGSRQHDNLVSAVLPSGAVKASTSIEFPSLTTVGLAYEWRDWTLAADVNLHAWSSFDELAVDFEGHPELSSVIVEEYEDARIYRLGLERRFSHRWAVRAGYHLDESPAPAASISPLLPDADRQGFSGGFSFRSGPWRLDMAAWLVLFEKRSTQGQSRVNYNGTYESRAELLALSLGYEF